VVINTYVRAEHFLDHEIVRRNSICCFDDHAETHLISVSVHINLMNLVYKNPHGRERDLSRM
jgi:hypothetical protein